MVMTSPMMDNTLPMMLRASRAALTSFDIGGAFTFWQGREYSHSVQTSYAWGGGGLTTRMAKLVR